MGEFERYLSRRMMDQQGYWLYFCRICGEYKPEGQFYKRESERFKIDTKCKIHYTKRDKDDDGEMDYLKLNPLKEEDFIGAQKLLMSMGYEYCKGCDPIHIQFKKRHNLK